MKKNILLVFTTLAVTVAASAQSFHLGLKLGANLDKVQGESFKEGYNLGFQGGAWAEIGIGEYLGIEPELLFNQTDTKYTSASATVLQQGNTALSDGSDIKLNYLTVPVLLNIKAAKILTLQLGPQYGILMNKHETILQNSEDAFKSGNFALVLGARVNLGGLKIYGRYNIGLSNISDAPDANKWTSQQVELGIGFTIL
jgi:hypothetical protein